MKRYRIQISIFGLILQILLMYLLARRIGHWLDISVYYILFSFATLLYSGFIERDSKLKRYCVQYFAGVSVSAVLAALFGGLSSVNFLWIFIFGIITAGLGAVLLYHFIYIIVPEGYKEEGFDFFFEIAVTFFLCSVYPVFLFIPLVIGKVVLFVFVMLAVSLLVGLVLSYPLKKAVQEIKEGLDKWEEMDKLPSIKTPLIKELGDTVGDFFVRIKESFASVKDMGSEIKTSSEDLSSVSEQMNASLQEVSSTIQQISKGAQEQSTAITSIARSIEELNNLTASISSQVKMASVSSRRTTSSAQQGMEFSKKEAEISKEIVKQTKFIEDKMSELRDQATEIKKILDIISSITEQTDLLALNAAIEAARVGEQGRGFAVVADEIRNLATETQRSSSIVENLISEINGTIEELSTLLTSERKKMVESKELAIKTDEQFTGIVKAVDLITDMITRINEAAVNQAGNTKELVKQVEQIAQVAAGTAAATEEVSAAVEEQTASMQEFTSTAQLLASFALKLDELLKKIKK